MDIVSKIRGQRFYAGQINRLDTTKACPSRAVPVVDVVKRVTEALKKAGRNPTDLPLLNSLMGALGLSRPYEHQEKALTGVLCGRDVILATGLGSGRSTVADVIALYRALEFSDNVLILCPNAISARHRLEACRRTLKQTGFDYAVRVVSISALLDSSIPEIVVATPDELMHALEAGDRQGIPAAFFSVLSLVIAEDIHEYTGTFGTNTATAIRCLDVLCRRSGSLPTVLATACPYGNLVSFAGQLFNRPFEKAEVIVEDGAPVLARQLVFWRAPMVRDGLVYRRKDLVRDMDDLLEFLSHDGIEYALGDRRFCFLVDRSSSMDEPSKFPRVLETVLADIEKRSVGNCPNDEAVFHFFTEELDAPLFDGKIGTWDKSASEGVNSATPEGGTRIGKALLNFLKRELRRGASDSGAASGNQLLLFIYSDGEDDVASDLDAEIRKLVNQLRTSGLHVSVFYVSLGIEPSPTVRVLIEGIGGVVVEVPQNATLEDPMGLLATAEIQRRGVVVLSFSDAVVKGDLPTTGATQRPIVFLPRLSHPAISTLLPSDYPSDAQLQQAKYIVVVGWTGSPSLLRHFISHAGQEDTVFFIVGLPDPVSRLVEHQWDRLSADEVCGFTPDRLALTHVQEDVGLRALASMASYGAMLSKSEACQILWGHHEEPAEGRLLQILARSRSLGVECDERIVRCRVQKNNLPMSKAFHVASEPVFARRKGEDPFAIDASATLSYLFEGAVCIINGIRYKVQRSSNQIMYDLVPTNPGRGLWTRPVLNIQVPELAAILAPQNIEEAKPVGVGGLQASAFKKSTIIEVERKGYRPFERGRGDSKVPTLPVSGVCSVVSLQTSVLALKFSTGTFRSEGVRCGIENIFWHFLGTLLRHDGACFCIAVPGDDVLLLGEIAPGANGMIDAVLEDGAALLGTVMQYGALSLLSCPCQAEDALRSLNQAIREGRQKSSVASHILQGSDDCGCGYCLRAAEKPWGMPEENAKKYETLVFLGENGFLTDESWKASLRDKYEVVDREDRFQLGNSPYEKGYVPEVQRIMADKLGASIPTTQLAKCRFFTMEERTENSGAGGLYISGENLVLASECVEFGMLDLLSHEYAHNWACVRCGNGYGWRSTYNDENVDDPGNKLCLFRGKIYVEGAAVWIESHVTDYFGNRQAITENTLRNGNEYWEGFKLFKYVEEKFGMQAVMDILTEGRFPDGVLSMSQLLIDSAVDSSVQCAGRTAVDDGLLTCLRQGFLNKPDDLVRFSAFLRGLQEPLDFPDIKSLKRSGRENVKRLLGPAKGVYSVKSLIEKVPGVKDYVAKQMPGLLADPSAADMRLELACHLHSNPQTSRMELWQPLIDIVVKYIDGVPLPPADQKGA